MPRGPELSPGTRNRIIGAKQMGIPLKEISNNLGISINTVGYTWRKRHERQELHQKSLPRGRPRKSTRQQDNELYRFTRAHPTATLRETVLHTPLQRTQMKARLKEIDPRYRKYKKSVRPLLNIDQKRVQLQFAELHQHEADEF
ncbi:MAG: hypothetical protein M1829_003006 [Trizodia sp. TS-e1964]|nr:MAG: hypothetical protein M1829_003006 [Trizodia sp. TS-e1964]